MRRSPLHPDRRAFLAGGLGAMLSACGWDGGPGLRPKLRAFSRFNDWVGGVLQSGERLAPTYDPVNEPAAFPPTTSAG